MNKMGAAFGRMSRREKILVGGLIGTIVVVVGFFVYLSLVKSTDVLQEKVVESQKSLLKIQRASVDYFERMGEFEERRRVARANRDVDLQALVDQAARGISYESRSYRGEPGPVRKLKDANMGMSQPTETWLSKRKRRAGKKKKIVRDGFWRRDQDVTWRDKVSFKALYAFMQKMDKPDQMRYVSKVQFHRDRRDGDYAQSGAKIVVSIITYRDKDEQ